MKRREQGDVGEQRACDFLRGLGYRIVARNWRSRFGEIDIVARDGEALVFVEVKLRATEEFGGPEAALTPAKRRRIIMAARHFQAQTQCDLPMRFDVVTMVGDRIQVIRNAFWVE